MLRHTGEIEHDERCTFRGRDYKFFPAGYAGLVFCGIRLAVNSQFAVVHIHHSMSLLFNSVVSGIPFLKFGYIDGAVGMDGQCTVNSVPRYDREQPVLLRYIRKILLLVRRFQSRFTGIDPYLVEIGH